MTPTDTPPEAAALDLERPFPKLLTEDEKKCLLKEAETLWRDLQENRLGGYSDFNRPFHILNVFKAVIEKFGGRDIGQTWSEVQLRAARSAKPGATSPSAGEWRHYARRAAMSGDMEIVDRQFDFVRCKLPYDYAYTSNSQQHREADLICRALEGPMEALGYAVLTTPAAGEQGGAGS